MSLSMVLLVRLASCWSRTRSMMFSLDHSRSCSSLGSVLLSWAYWTYSGRRRSTSWSMFFGSIFSPLTMSFTG